MKRIAIQGELGSFHDITAHEYFEGEQIELICCATFEEVFENIKRDPTVIGITAIEIPLLAVCFTTMSCYDRVVLLWWVSIGCTSNIVSVVFRRMIGVRSKRFTLIL